TGDELAWVDRWPVRVDDVTDRRLAGELVSYLGKILVGLECRPDRVGILMGENGQDLVREGRTGLVVRAAGTARPSSGRSGHRWSQHELDLVNGHDNVVLGNTLVGLDGGGDHVDHRRVTFDCGDLVGVHSGRGHTGEGVSERGHDHAGLPKGGEYLLDIAQERPVWPDDQHTTA